MSNELLYEIRNLYAIAANDSQKAIKLRNLVARLSNPHAPLLLAYQAAGEALKARETWLPWEKLAHFQKAMSLFAQAIQQNPTQIEVRFLRYTIQANTPTILGMNVNLAEDKQVILQYIQTDTTDEYMKISIAKYLFENALLTPQEKEILQYYK